MKILLTNTIGWEGISAGSRWPHKTNGVYNPPHLRYMPYPRWLSITSSLLKRHGYEVKFVDPPAEYLSEDRYYKTVKHFNPDITVIEVSTPTFDICMDMAKKIKGKIGSKIIFVGIHPTIFFKDCLSSDYVDFIIRGEYEFSILEIIKILDEGGDFKKIKGIGYKSNGKNIFTEERPLLENLDNLPFPDWEGTNLWLYNDSWLGYEKQYPGVQLEASRGCIFKCPYCQWSKVLYRHTYRMFSNDYVIKMMEYVKDIFPAVKQFYFDDDTFNLRPEKSIMDLCNKIVEESIDVPWAIMAHPQLTTEDIIKEMGKAGLHAAKWGLESNDQKVLNGIKKGIKLDHFEKTLEWCKKYDVKSHITIMFGLPNQTYKSALGTMKYVTQLYKKRLIDSAQFSICTPYPGTDLLEISEKNNWIVDKGFQNFDSTCSVLSYPYFTKEEIEKACLKMIKMYRRVTYMRKIRESWPKELLQRLREVI